ncbi:MAG: alcohol dehydrogenase catalytic domain-containing protein [Elusimicrobia bacterium]|nr:alcohol dehydrogenase catalytic domain-containing protein [Elusimicrobiota bacterium]
MKAILYEPRLGAALQEVPVPGISESEALLEVEACGVCGTDLMKLETRAERAVLGHELSGRLVKVGAAVLGFREGDRVALAHHVPCLKCRYCAEGHESMCRDFKASNIDPCGFAEYVRIPQAHLGSTVFKIPESLDFLSASQMEPTACCLRNVRRLGVGPGAAVGIVGLGAIGILMAQLLKRAGASVLGLDLDESRAQALSPWGEGFVAPPAMEEAISRKTTGRGLDALIFCAGSARLAAERLSWLRDGGTLNIFASVHPPQAELDLNQLYHRELTVMSSYSPSLADLRQALELLADGSVKIAPLRPKAYRLEDFPQAARDLRARAAMKAVLVPRGP